MRSPAAAFAGLACLFLSVACAFPWLPLARPAGTMQGVLCVALAGCGVYAVAWGLGLLSERPKPPPGAKGAPYHDLRIIRRRRRG